MHEPTVFNRQIAGIYGAPAMTGVVGDTLLLNIRKPKDREETR